MADPFRWVGPKTLKRGKATWNFSAEKVTVNFAYMGPMAECIARRPLIGSAIAEFDKFGLKVSSAVATEGDADTGTLAIVLEADVAPSEVPDGPVGEPVYEIVWGELTKPLETHQHCGRLKPGRPRYHEGAVVTDTAKPGKQRTWEDWADLDADDYDATGTGVWTLAVYKAKKEAGIDSYNIGAPVIRRTMYYLRKPPGLGVGLWRPQEPPGAAEAPAGWHWIFTSDECCREGKKRTRKSEWTGARAIDEDLYP